MKGVDKMQTKMLFHRKELLQSSEKFKENAQNEISQYLINGWQIKASNAMIDPSRRDIIIYTLLVKE